MNGYIYLILNQFESKFSTIYTFIHVISYYLFLFLLNIIHHIYSVSVVAILWPIQNRCYKMLGKLSEVIILRGFVSTRNTICVNRNSGFAISALYVSIMFYFWPQPACLFCLNEGLIMSWETPSSD